jgi:ABC-2 type transport system ATP-binding protein
LPLLIEANRLVKHSPGATEPDGRGISFGILEGEVVSLLGPNDAGTTTMIGMLSCLLRPASSDAIIGGAPITQNPDAMKRQIGVAPQDIALYPAPTALLAFAAFFWARAFGGSATSNVLRGTRCALVRK